MNAHRDTILMLDRPTKAETRELSQRVWARKMNHNVPVVQDLPKKFYNPSEDVVFHDPVYAEIARKARRF